MDDEKGKEEKGNGGSNTGAWGFVTKVYDGPIAKSLLAIGLAALLAAILRGVPKVITLDRPQIIGIAIFGGFLVILSGIIWKVNSSTPDSPKDELKFLTWVFLLVGVSSCAVFLITHIRLGSSGGKPSIVFEMDELVIMLALATVCGFLPAYFSARKLKVRSDEIGAQMRELKTVSDNVPKRIDEQFLRAEANQKEFLERLKKSEESLVKHVQDSTRTMLKGFHEVFAMALSMVKDAEQELIFINFAMNFGAAHLVSDAIKADYEKENATKENTPKTLSDGVRVFRNTLIEKIKELPDVKILTLYDHKLKENFFDPLSERGGYQKLKEKERNKKGELEDKTAIELREAIRAKNTVIDALQDPPDSSQLDNGRRYLEEAESLPLQLLITKTRDKNKSLRRACLVFMVGTDMLKSGVSAGGEPAFYTELDDMVDVFDKLATALIIAAQRRKEEIEAKKKEDARKLLDL